MTAIPITIVATAFSIMNLIDSLTLYQGLAKIGYAKEQTREIIGQLGKINSVINFPLTISVALSVAIVPAVANSFAAGDRDKLIGRIKQGLRLGLLTALPAAIGLLVLAKPVLILLYPSANGYEFLQVLSVCLIFMIMGQSLAGILQGLSNQYMALISLIIAAVIKVVLNMLFIPTALGSLGAVISSLVYYTVFTLINLFFVKRHTPFKFDLLNGLLKPLFRLA